MHQVLSAAFNRTSLESKRETTFAAIATVIVF